MELTEAADVSLDILSAEMLRRIADHINRCLHGRGMLASFSGIRFTVFGHQLVVSPDFLASQLCVQLNLDGVIQPVTFHAGLVRRDDFPSASSHELLRYAGLALKQAQKSGRWVYYSG